MAFKLLLVIEFLVNRPFFVIKSSNGHILGQFLTGDFLKKSFAHGFHIKLWIISGSNHFIVAPFITDINDAIFCTGQDHRLDPNHINLSEIQTLKFRI